jgi:N-acetylneuraminate synthase
MLKRLELDEEAHLALLEHCRKCKVEFMSTPFDTFSLAFLVERCSLKRLKLPSGELTNGPLLLAAARTELPILLSTGMGTLGEVEEALMVLAFGYLNPSGHPTKEALLEAFISDEGQDVLRERVTLLHCTSEYPAPLKEVHLRSMDTMAAAFGLRTGYSDHTEGIAVPLAAVARGAVVIEKHFTLDRSLPGPDHRSSLEPHELAAMVQGIREVETALGRPAKTPSRTELRNRIPVRKSVVAAANIEPGQLFSESNLTAKRPGDGISAMRYWELLGRPANRSYNQDDKIEL